MARKEYSTIVTARLDVNFGWLSDDPAAVVT
jgi:hypothetical protein